MRYTQVSAATFTRFLRRNWDAKKGDVTIGSMLHPDARYIHHYDGGARCYLANDCRSGFVIRPKNPRDYYGDLQTVWSIVNDRGDELVATAFRHGAVSLDCFDGYLVDFYKRNGFQEVRREKNWTEGGPDVVFMEREAYDASSS